MVWHAWRMTWYGTARRDVTVRYDMVWYSVYNMLHTVYGHRWHMWYGIITIIIWLCY